MSKLSTCVEDVKNRDGSQKMPLHNYRSELLSNRGTGRQGVQSLAHRKVSYGSNRGRRRVTFNPSSRTRHGAVLEVSRYTARQRNPVGVKLRTLPPWLILQLLVRKVVFLNFRVQRKYDRDVEMRKSSRGVERAASDPFVDATNSLLSNSHCHATRYGCLTSALVFILSYRVSSSSQALPQL